MIDAHCHLNFHAFDKDLDKVIISAKENGIEKIINVGTSIDSSIHAVELASKYDNLYAIIGIHPHHADKLENGWEKKIKILAKNKKVVGIGEIGMDFYSYQSNGIVNPKLQKSVFEAQIQLAHDLNLPLQIHNRHAGKDIIEILMYHKNILKSVPGMFHCFASTKKVLKDLLDLGFFVGFDGNITYKGLAPGESVELKELVKLTPLERIIVETDSPFLAPIPKRGSRNEPSHAIIVGEFIAKVKKTPFKNIDRITTKNTNIIFNL